MTVQKKRDPRIPLSVLVRQLDQYTGAPLSSVGIQVEKAGT